jgi:hypothetical protein
MDHYVSDSKIKKAVNFSSRPFWGIKKAVETLRSSPRLIDIVQVSGGRTPPLNPATTSCF